MKIYEIEIKTKSAFITPLQGDTLFGAICCQIDAEKRDALLSGYKTNPYIIVSSLFFKDKSGAYIFKKPSCPGYILFPNQTVENRKENDKKKYFKYDGKGIIELDKLNWYGGKDENLKIESSLQHNTINRNTYTTGEGEFAPYSMEGFFYNKDIKTFIFAAIDEECFSIDELKEALKKVGAFGFGKRASIGYGQFDVIDRKETKIFETLSGDFAYSLSPFVLSDSEKAAICEDNLYFTPFIRYGKHGGQLAKSAKPFKKPIIMADEGALLKMQFNNRHYLGSAICDVSEIDPKTVAQGYALFLKVQMPKQEA
jgi:CRISPR-associated protein Csm4